MQHQLTKNNIMENFSNVCQLLMQARKSVIKSYRRFAEEIGMSSHTVSNIEKGYQRMVSAS